MGKFGCTQIRTSSSYSSAPSKKKKDFFVFLFLGGLEYFCQKFNQPVDKNGQKILLTLFLIPQGTFLANKGGYRGKLGEFWPKCSPIIAD